MVSILARSPLVTVTILSCLFIWVVIALFKWRNPFAKQAAFWKADAVKPLLSDDGVFNNIIGTYGRNRFYNARPIEVRENEYKQSEIVTSMPNKSLYKAAVHDESIEIDEEDSLEFLNMKPNSENVRQSMYDRLARKYLGHWLSFSDTTKNMTAPVTPRMLNLMEYVYKGGSFRVRYFQGKLLYRVLVRYNQTYRFDRMVWLMSFLSEMDKEGLLKYPFDVIIYVGDGPKVPADTFDKFAGFPLFSIRTSPVHVDIPIPDPVIYGSNGNYQWPLEATTVPWDQKTSTAIFRGKASCLKMQGDNWHACNRVRAAKLSSALSTQESPPLFDIGITEWNQVGGLHGGQVHVTNDGFGLVPPPTPEEIEISTGLKTVQPMDYFAQSNYKYIIDLDGGLGSSRKAGILGSGSLLLAQDSPWRTWYDPCLRPFYHYLPFSRNMENLKSRVKWARKNESAAKRMMQAGRDFAERFLSRASAKQYFAAVLNLYAKELISDPSKIDDRMVDMNFCQLTDNKDIPRGPLGCSQGWFQWDDVTSPIYWKKTIKSMNRKRKVAEDIFQ